MDRKISLGSEQPGTPISDHNGRAGASHQSRSWFEIEFKRRVASGEALTTLTHEADALSDWLIQTYPKTPQNVSWNNKSQIPSGSHRTWKSTKLTSWNFVSPFFELPTRRGTMRVQQHQGRTPVNVNNPKVRPV